MPEVDKTSGQLWWYLSAQSIWWKIYEGEMFIRSQLTTLLHMIRKFLQCYFRKFLGITQGFKVWTPRMKGLNVMIYFEKKKSDESNNFDYSIQELMAWLVNLDRKNTLEKYPKGNNQIVHAWLKVDFASTWYLHLYKTTKANSEQISHSVFAMLNFLVLHTVIRWALSGPL